MSVDTAAVPGADLADGHAPSWHVCRCGVRHADAEVALFDDVESVFAEADRDDPGGGVDGPGEDAGRAALLWDAPEPAWVRDAYTAALREDLSAAASGPAGRKTLALLSLLDPEKLSDTARRTGLDNSGNEAEAEAAAGMLLDGVVAAQRLINHVHAIQQRLIAAFCRPGVAVPLAGLVDLAGDDLTDAPRMDASGSAAVLDRATNPVSSTDPASPGPDHAANTGVTGGCAVATALGRDGSDGEGDPALPCGGGDDPARSARAGVLRQEAVKAAAAEIGCALRLAPVTARMRCENALDLVDHYPATVRRQQAGDVDPYRARLIAGALAVLPGHLRPVVERRVLPASATATTARLRRLIGREVIAADPAAAERRVETAKNGRTVYTSRGEHNTGVFTAIVSAADAELASATLDAIADTMVGTGHSDCRSRAQLRADAFTDLFRTLATTGQVALTGHATDADTTAAVTGAEAPAAAASAAAWCGTALSSGRTGTVAAYRRPVALNVYIDAATLAGLDDRPGELAGHGAITATTARALAASADTVRAIIARPAGPNRTCNTILDAGRAVYRPPDPTADHVTARDRTCTFPGCRAPARRCDLDHRRPFDGGGDTCPCNLDVLCRAHHRLKTFTAWRATPDPTTGRLTWMSPLRQYYPGEQAHLLCDHPTEPEPGNTSATDTADGIRTGMTNPADDPPPF